MTRKFLLNIELINGEPFVCVQNLIDMLEGSMSKNATQFDFAIFQLANQLKEFKNQALQTNLPQGEEKHES